MTQDERTRVITQALAAFLVDERYACRMAHTARIILRRQARTAARREARQMAPDLRKRNVGS